MTNLFLDKGVPSVKWRDSKNILHTCTEESYNKIFKQAMKETKSARDHDNEERIEKIEEDEHDIKKKEEANDEEIKERKLEEIRKSLRPLSAEELKDELLKVQEELDNMKKDKTDSKSASKLEHVGYDNHEAKGHYSVLAYNMNSTESREGDSLMKLMGSV